MSRAGSQARRAIVDTLFLDAGNTLISMNYDWIAAELGRCGLACEPAAVARAEAASRPSISRYVADYPDSGGHEHFVRYLADIAGRLPGQENGDPALHERVGREAARRLKRPGRDFELWNRVLPRVPEALAALHEMGMKLVVVSNSDGSVARALEDLGLGRWLDAVLDSAVVGYEKPDSRFFAHALRIAGSDSTTTLHVGDMYYQDVLGARGAGIEPVLIDPHDDWAIDDCLRLRDLAALVDWLRAVSA